MLGIECPVRVSSGQSTAKHLGDWFRPKADRAKSLIYQEERKLKNPNYARRLILAERVGLTGSFAASRCARLSHGCAVLGSNQ